MGRLSINPLRHIDFIGTLIVPLLIAILSHFQFIFGWAKPVPINYNLLRNPRRDSAFVAAAGPLSNFFMAVLWALLFKVATLLHPQTSLGALYLLLTAQAGIVINLVLAFLNLIPLPPLDGSKIVASLLPPKQAIYFLSIERFGIFILIALLLTGGLNWLLYTPLVWTLSFFNTLMNL